jgi:hypothetical protein
MKRLSLYLFLILFILPTPSQADDIRDFQIEGMSIGDSLLDHFSEREIKKARQKKQYPGSNKFIISTFLKKKKKPYEIYEMVTINHRNKNKNYEIVSLAGRLLFNNNDQCIKKKDEIVNEISEIFEDTFLNNQSKKHRGDKTGKSIITMTIFTFKSDDGVQVSCTDWSEDMGFKDGLKVTVANKEYIDFILNEAYK